MAKKHGQESLPLTQPDRFRNENNEVVDAEGNVYDEDGINIVREAPEAPSEDRKQFLAYYEMWLKVYQEKNRESGGYQSEETVQDLARRHALQQQRDQKETERKMKLVENRKKRAEKK